MYNFCILDVWMDDINTDVLGHYIIIVPKTKSSELLLCSNTFIAQLLMWQNNYFKFSSFKYIWIIEYHDTDKVILSVFSL